MAIRLICSPGDPQFVGDAAELATTLLEMPRKIETDFARFVFLVALTHPPAESAANDDKAERPRRLDRQRVPASTGRSASHAGHSAFPGGRAPSGFDIDRAAAFTKMLRFLRLNTKQAIPAG